MKALPDNRVVPALVRATTQPLVSPHCEVCNAKVHELRRGRCWGCYSQWAHARPVGAGARCVTCNEKRRKVLKAVELFGSWKPMCFNCAGQLMHLDPMPFSIGEMRAIVSRERRKVDRRIGKPDTRVFQYERRVGDRRTPRELKPATRAEDVVFDDLVYDDMIIEISIDDIEVVGEPGMEFEDITAIRDMIVDLRPSGYVVASAG